MSDRTSTTVRTLATAAIALAALGYLVTRAIHVPLTYDEAASYFSYVAAGPMALFDFNVATNHFLNSVLSRLSHAFFGADTWALRLPSLAAGAGYVACAAAVSRGARDAAVGLAGMLLLTTNPYVMDYLALSRGYGLALALVLGSVLMLGAWMAHPPDAPAARRACVWSVGLGAAAVSANFAAITTFLAVVAVVSLRLGFGAWRSLGAAALPAARMRWSWRTLAAWALLTTAFSAAVISREKVLDQSLFTPVAVRVAGLFEDEASSIRVFRVDARDRLRELDRGPDGTWRTGELGDAWGLRVTLPVSVDRNLAALDVTIGERVFRRDRRTDGPWEVHDADGERVLVSSAALGAPLSGHAATARAINWAGNLRHGLLTAARTALVMAGLMTLAAVLLGLAAWLRRRPGVPAAGVDAASAALLVVASFAAAPAYLLQRNGQLYFGGTTGLVADTFSSLLQGTAYGVPLPEGLVRAVLVGLGLVAAAVPVVLLASRRARAGAGWRPAIATWGVLVLVSVGIVAQHRWLGTRYLTGRTALTLVPLVLLFLAQAGDAIARLGGAFRVASTLAMVLLATLGVGHFVNTANLSGTLDWPDDRDTPALFEAMARDAGANVTAPARLRVGVEWMFYPAARYYAERLSTAATSYTVEVVPDEWPPFDYLFVRGGSALGSGTRLDTFPLTGAVLWRAVPAPP